MSETKTKPDELTEEAFDGEVMHHKAQNIALCATHSKDNWMTHDGYIANSDGTISCSLCPWGTPLAGYFRVMNGRVIDLRNLNRS